MNLEQDVAPAGVPPIAVAAGTPGGSEVDLAAGIGVLDALGEATFVVRVTGAAAGFETRFVSEAFLARFAGGPEQVRGAAPHELPGCHGAAVRSAYEAALRTGTAQVTLTGPGGDDANRIVVSSLKDRDGVVHLVGVVHAVSDAERLAEQLEFERRHDELTGLGNRVALGEELTAALERAHAFGTRVALLLVDIDAFATLNDGAGHSLGDDVLVALAERLESEMRFGDSVHRLAGDEFALVCADVHGAEEVGAIAGRVLGRVADPLMLDHDEVCLTACIGVVMDEGADDTAMRLLRDADVALVAAKARGRSSLEWFTPELRSRAVHRLETEQGLRRALERGELRVYYQPLVQLVPTEVIGFEALLRWEHPTRGLLTPAEFIEVAEHTGLIVPIGEWVLHEVCRQAAQWSGESPGAPPLLFSVNLSARQLAHPRLAETVAAAIADAGIDPSLLALEVTETAIMADPQLALRTLGLLGALGVQVAIDDFGVGYSSLAYLRELPVHAIKIDRAFVSGLDRSADDRAIVEAVVHLGHALGLTVTAEGIETPDQLARLEVLGCDAGQGYYFAKPQPSEVAGVLARHRLRWEVRAA